MKFSIKSNSQCFILERIFLRSLFLLKRRARCGAHAPSTRAVRTSGERTGSLEGKILVSTYYSLHSNPKQMS